jgi:hypothetical protein
MAASIPPVIESFVTPAHVWASLSCDQRTAVIAAVARLAVHWLTVQPVPQHMPCCKEAHDVPYFDPSQNPAGAS